MQRINSSDGQFHNGDGRTTLGTIVTAEWLNSVQGELVNIFTSLGGDALKAEKNNQIAELLMKAFAGKSDATEFKGLRNVLVGVPIPYPLATVPEGCLALNGQKFDTSRYPQLAKLYPTGTLPDLRGEFLRGWDNGRGVDAGRGLLSWQYGSLLVQEAHYQVNNVVSPSGNTAENLGLDKTDSSLTNRIKMTTAVADNREANWYAVPGTYATDAQIPYVGMARPRNITFNYICLAG